MDSLGPIGPGKGSQAGMGPIYWFSVGTGPIPPLKVVKTSEFLSHVTFSGVG